MSEGFTIAVVVSAVIFFLFFAIASICNDDVLLSYTFCEDKGYDYSPTFNAGTYSQYFGQVKCTSYFDGKEASEVFNVTKKCFLTYCRLVEGRR